MPKLRLLILDANVVITLHDLGIWSKVVDKCDIHVSRTVVKESAFSGCNEAGGVSIDLSADEDAVGLQCSSWTHPQSESSSADLTAPMRASLTLESVNRWRALSPRARII